MWLGTSKARGQEPGRAVLGMAPPGQPAGCSPSGIYVEIPRLPGWPIACMHSMQGVRPWRAPSWAFKVGWQLCILLRPIRGTSRRTTSFCKVDIPLFSRRQICGWVESCGGEDDEAASLHQCRNRG